MIIFCVTLYFRFEAEQDPELTCKSVQQPIKNFKGLIKISIMMLVIKQNGIN